MEELIEELTQARMDITLKINEIPKNFQTTKKGWFIFSVNAGGLIVKMRARPRVWNRLVNADAEFPEWVAIIKGQFGQKYGDGLTLENFGVQVFEKNRKRKNGDS